MNINWFSNHNQGSWFFLIFSLFDDLWGWSASKLMVNFENSSKMAKNWGKIKTNIYSYKCWLWFGNQINHGIRPWPSSKDIAKYVVKVVWFFFVENNYFLYFQKNYSTSTRFLTILLPSIQYPRQCNATYPWIHRPMVS